MFNKFAGYEETIAHWRRDGMTSLKADKLPDACTDHLNVWHRLLTGDPNSNRNYEVFWGEGREKRAFENRHASTQDYIEYMSTDLAASGGRPRRVELAQYLGMLDAHVFTAFGDATALVVEHGSPV